MLVKIPRYVRAAKSFSLIVSHPVRRLFGRKWLPCIIEVTYKIIKNLFHFICTEQSVNIYPAREKCVTKLAKK